MLMQLSVHLLPLHVMCVHHPMASTPSKEPLVQGVVMQLSVHEEGVHCVMHEGEDVAQGMPLHEEQVIHCVRWPSSPFHCDGKHSERVHQAVWLQRSRKRMMTSPNDQVLRGP